MIKTQELSSILSSGLSLRQIMLPPIIIIFIIGCVVVMLFNPIGGYGLKKYDQAKMKLNIKSHSSSFTIAPKGLFFLEDYKNPLEINNKEYRVIYVQSLSRSENKMINITVLFLDGNYQLIKRIDAKQATFNKDELVLTNAKIIRENVMPIDTIKLPTNLSFQQLVDSFESPETISVWNLSKVIASLSKYGLPTLSYEIYYYKQLFKPFYMVSMAILASCFLALRVRDNYYKKLLIIGLIAGFAFYIINEIILRILAYNGLVVKIAVLLPVMLLLLISNLIYLYLHE